MRTKFKAWDKENKCWLTDKDNVYLNEDGIAYRLLTGASSDYLRRVDVDIVFYTGLNDKNGKEIYEGHIISMESAFYRNVNDIYYVQFGAWCNCLYKPNGDFFASADRIKSHQSTVIGNIYQNRDLLK